MRISDLAGKACLVTGSSRGIGAAVARGLGASGARVAVHYRTGEAEARAVAQIPMRRVGTAEECVGAFLFLCSAAMSGYVTGQVIEVNGGLLIP
ncbi:SDR family oxidoreductase [Elioraea tepidiphila]|jgi:NAD(P)-dependent dehydrogenase (short-subunit alcohol dehydrogenase family)|uniref:SDR family oxidoreductase n=1 Tax=Elioraea tepidiphila TaxID=457934 RepID=UPI00036F28DA|nr:SDR family oxidoreductase [Elioraea tepidiphila]